MLSGPVAFPCLRCLSAMVSSSYEQALARSVRGRGLESDQFAQAVLRWSWQSHDIFQLLMLTYQSVCSVLPRVAARI